MLEFVETEQSYVKDLYIIKVVWKESMIRAVSDKYLPFSEEEIDKIFCNIDEIYGVNFQILSDIVNLCNDWSPSQCVGKNLKDLVHFLRIYTSYSINYNDAIDILNAYDHKTYVKEFFQALRNFKVCSRHDLKSFLIRPIQRIPRYLLLVQDFIKKIQMIRILINQCLLKH